MSNRLDPDQAGCYGGPDLDPNCLHILSADSTCRQRVAIYNKFCLLSHLPVYIGSLYSNNMYPDQTAGLGVV